MRISDKIRFLRKEHNMSQKDLARELHVSSQAVSNWELDKGFPDIGNLIRISDIFNISLDELVKEDADLKQNLIDGKVEKKVGIFLSTIVLIGCFFILLIAIYKTIMIGFNELNTMGLVVGTLGTFSFTKELATFIKK